MPPSSSPPTSSRVKVKNVVKMVGRPLPSTNRQTPASSSSSIPFIFAVVIITLQHSHFAAAFYAPLTPPEPLPILPMPSPIGSVFINKQLQQHQQQQQQPLFAAASASKAAPHISPTDIDEFIGWLTPAEKEAFAEIIADHIIFGSGSQGLSLEAIKQRNLGLYTKIAEFAQQKIQAFFARQKKEINGMTAAEQQQQQTTPVR